MPETMDRKCKRMTDANKFTANRGSSIINSEVKKAHTKQNKNVMERECL